MILRLTCAALIIVSCASRAALSQVPDQATQILALAKSGRGGEAWQRWAGLPATESTARLGVTLAIVTGQLQRGVMLYDDLTKKLGRPDRPALTELAVAIADDLATSPDLDARLGACAAAVSLKPTDAVCRKAIDDLVNSSDSDERAWALYSLANAGIQLRPGDLSIAERSMSDPMRLRMAQTMTHIPAADRVFMLQPVLDSPDVAKKYQAILLLANIPGRESVGALRNLEGAAQAAPLKNAVLIGLARHGDQPSLESLTDLVPQLDGYEKAQATAALAQGRRTPAAALQLELMLQTGAELERLAAVEAAEQTNPQMARQALRDLLRTGSPAAKLRAMAAAGKLELGTDATVYRRFGDVSPIVRAAAVAAIQETFAMQDVRSKARRP